MIHVHAIIIIIESELIYHFVLFYVFFTIGSGAHKFTFRRAATCGSVLSLKQYKVYCG